MKLVLAIAMLLGGGKAQAAAILKGVVQTNEVGGAPIANVGVAADGANPTATDSFGRFRLAFPNKSAGETVLLIVRRRGLVVVNDIQLERVLPADGDNGAPLVLLLSREGDREEMARRYYRLRSLEAVEESYRKRMKQLEAERRSDTSTLEQLRRERDQALAAAATPSGVSPKEKPADGPGLYREGMRQFLEGNVNEAVEVLEDEKLRQMLGKAEQSQAELDKQVAQVTQAWLAKARFLTLQLRFDEAERAYRNVTQTAPGSFDACFEYARFSENLNRFRAALNGYQRCLALARTSGNQPEIAQTLNRLGNLHDEENRPREARQAYEEALKIRRELARTDPDRYLRDVAGTLNNLGNLLSEVHQPAEARQAYEEALKIERELGRTSPDSYFPRLASTLDNLGMLEFDVNRMKEAEAAFDEALRIRRGLAGQNGDESLHDLAMTLNNLGILYRGGKRLQESREAHEEAVRIHRGLASHNPETYLARLAGSLNNLGRLHEAEKRMHEAEKVYRESLEIQSELARTYPDAYLPGVAGAQLNLGNVYHAQDRTQKAREAYGEALKCFRDLARNNAETYLPEVAMTLNNLGILHRRERRNQEARQAFGEALEIYQKFAKESPGTFSSDVERVKGLLDSVRRN